MTDPFFLEDPFFAFFEDAGFPLVGATAGLEPDSVAPGTSSLSFISTSSASDAGAAGAVLSASPLVLVTTHYTARQIRQLGSTEFNRGSDLQSSPAALSLRSLQLAKGHSWSRHLVCYRQQPEKCPYQCWMRLEVQLLTLRPWCLGVGSYKCVAIQAVEILIHALLIEVTREKKF